MDAQIFGKRKKVMTAKTRSPESRENYLNCICVHKLSKDYLISGPTFFAFLFDNEVYHKAQFMRCEKKLT